MNVTIFGAGPCGLTAAWELAKKGVQVTIVEQDSVVGGLCKTVRRDGFQFDLGGHRFISKDLELVNDIKELMKGDLLTRIRKSVIRFHDREYEYPLNIRNVTSASSLWMTLRFAVGYLASLTGLRVSHASPGSFEHWVDSKFGRPINTLFFKPYTEKLWGIPATRLSDEWAGQRISLLDGKDLLFKLLGLSRSIPRTFASRYLYPKSGIGALFERMAAQIEDKGGEVITDACITKLETKDNRLLRVWVKNSQNEKRCIEADHFLSTIPLEKMVALLDYDQVELLPYRSLRFLNIFVNRENLSPNTWIYVPETDFIMTRIQEPKQRSPYSAPQGKTSVMLEIPCDQGDTVWTMQDDTLLDRALNDLKKLGFHIAHEVEGCFSTRASHAYPRYEIGYHKKLQKMRTVVERYENLMTLGRQGLFRYIFMDTAMCMGRDWARSLLQGSGPVRRGEENMRTTVIEAQSIAA